VAARSKRGDTMGVAKVISVSAVSVLGAFVAFMAGAVLATVLTDENDSAGAGYDGPTGHEPGYDELEISSGDGALV
jgi:hypothetical protein